MSTFEIKIIVCAGDAEISEGQALDHFEKVLADFESYSEIKGPVTFIIGDLLIRAEDAISQILPSIALETVDRAFFPINNGIQ